ncbi:carboxylesterase family protein [Polynucleobacter sp. Ross1-W9]|uniref:carboxylesterase/lipase family protein n=1 Tax=Polynucleobacter parvulilacunae TaxID=1855631 RepID=UPI001C0AF315|nr:carboxylesterase family protein [Polynucleobacter parvulilacunae]MBU3556987.1 carboxylesterase family protein [Polynucleobacter parvulilacunae]
MKKLLGILLAAIALSAYSVTERPVIQIEAGKLQGTVEYNMHAFKNIPYAAPPVGDLRWRPPQPPASWSGTRDAGQFGDSCPQPFVKNLSTGLGLPGSEDCLKLNVFTPQKAGKDLPVMVWIHGGGLLVDGARDAQFTPINLVKNGVIVVTFDYRLGTFGFFASQELIEEAKAKGEPVGNYGTMDQIAVLKWVKDNIAAFGGDPNNVTIFGESAGGRSVTWLMVSDAARGLFHRAIAESAQQSPLRGMTEKRLGMVPETEIDAKYMNTVGAKNLKELRNLPTQKLVLTAANFEQGEFGGPFIDGQILKGDPVPLFAAGKQAKVPFMIGTNSWDSSFLVPGQPSMVALSKMLREDPKIVQMLYSNIKDKCIIASDALGDMLYRGSTKLLADSMNGVAPGYAYYFDYLTEKIRPAYPGVPHTFEISYVFGSYGLMPQAPKKVESGANHCARIEQATADLKKKGIWSKYWYPITNKDDPQDQAMSEKMSASWAAFAKTGNPNVSGQANWPVYNLNADVMRSFSYDQETTTGLLKDRVAYQILHLREIFALERLKDAF